MDATKLSRYLCEGDDPDLRRRRWVIGLSLVGTAAGQIVGLYQTGIVKHLPDPPLRGLEMTPCPSNFPLDIEMNEVSYKYMNFSEGEESREGRWANGPTKDGRGEFQYVERPEAMGPQVDELAPPTEPRLYSTPRQPTSS
jgi:Mn-containing catalase